MGSTGTGNFSDYKNFPRAIKGITGADDSEDKCALAFSTFIEDVDTCEYYTLIPQHYSLTLFISA